MKNTPVILFLILTLALCGCSAQLNERDQALLMETQEMAQEAQGKADAALAQSYAAVSSAERASDDASLAAGAARAAQMRGERIFDTISQK